MLKRITSMICALMLLCLASSCRAEPSDGTTMPDAPYVTLSADTEEISWYGRTTVEKGKVSFDWTGTYCTFNFSGSELYCHISDTHQSFFNVIVDGKLSQVFHTSKHPGRKVKITLFKSEDATTEHTITICKRTEAKEGKTTLHAFVISSDAKLSPCKPKDKNILFIGDSITCGYGNEATPDKHFEAATENCSKAYSGIISRYYDADYTFLAHSGLGMVHNYGDQHQISEGNMQNRILRTFDEEEPLWDFSKESRKPDLVIINLGANDYSNVNAPTMEQFHEGYSNMLGIIRKHYGDTPVLCIAMYSCVPATRIGDYVEAFVSKKTAEGDHHLHMVRITPGLYEKHKGADNHPNYDGHQLISKEIIPVIQEVTGWTGNKEIK